MRIVMIGGTGFLGYFTCRELAARGHDVLAVGLEYPPPEQVAATVRCAVCDLETCSDSELAALLDGAEAVIYAAGADGRFSGAMPVIEAYRRHNVEPMRRLLPAMRAAHVAKLVIFGSYYTTFARERPELVDLARNPYPLSRQEQMDLAFDLAHEDVAVEVLELPYIFGGAPGQGTLWGFVMEKIAAEGPVPVSGGGTACVTANQVAAAAAGAVERRGTGAAWPIGGENLSYRAIYALFADALGLKPNLVLADPAEEYAAAEAQRQRLSQAGIGTGYDPVDIVRWGEANLFIDPGPAMLALDYGPDDIASAIRDTVAATQAHGGQGPASLRET